MNNLKAVDRVISSVWTLEYRQVSDTEIELIRYSRNDEEGYDREHELPEGVVIEDDNRVVIGARIDGKEFSVINRKYVFSYNG